MTAILNEPGVIAYLLAGLAGLVIFLVTYFIT